MLSYRFLQRIDIRIVCIIFALMALSLVNISSYSDQIQDSARMPFWTPLVKTQIQWFMIGWLVFFIAAAFDYNKLREWAWILYVLSIISLIGLFFTDPIQNVRRWYRIPYINYSFQPSEYAKLALVFSLSWYLERRALQSHNWSTALGGLVIFGIPFVLILKQPDLGTSLVLFPMTLVMFYFGGINRSVLNTMLFFGTCALLVCSAFFTGIISHEEARPYVTRVLKE